MIAFSCSHCGMKLKVKEQFAGRQSKCPSCKQPLVVPTPSATAPFVPPQQIDGTESSLAKAGIQAGVTLDTHDTSQLPSGKSLAPALAGRKSSKERYVIEGEIARGGMGAVLRAIDCDIRREVAVKYMLDAKDPRKQARFVEEAQINGQLEHPNIVPVYDLGIDTQKRPFIMMKMVKGRSLKDVLDQLREQPRQAEREYTLGRLLNILVNVCNALAFAHSRGVIHRDLKPANVMLGDFGEVYVMDWGLAKVLGNTPEPASPMATIVATPALAAPAMAAPAAGVSLSHNSKVVTSREPETDLTQEGSVLGTPVYMPPEQASGNLQAVDQRSDVYALGAILYELLALQPPIDKEGGHLAVLMRVMQGEMVPPEQRAPQRARKGQIPKELSAIAVKALAKDPAHRYPTVLDFRRDIERFQEGRSVSAKVDTRREMILKFVKRNKGFSAGMAATFAVLLCSLWFIGKAWLVANQALADQQREQEAKREQGRKSVPAFVRAARLLINEKQFPDALAQVDAALSFNESDADARLLRGQLLIGTQQYPEASKELAVCLKLRPGDEKAQKLAELCREARPDHRQRLLALADELGRQKMYTLADQVTQQAEALRGSRQEMLAHYQKRIESAWPGLSNRLRFDDVGFHLDLSNQGAKVKDLTPLQGMKLASLSVWNCPNVRDLTPLQGMPLTALNLSQNPLIRDLTPLRGLKLNELYLNGCGAVGDLTPLQGMPLGKLQANYCPLTDLMPLQGMPLKELTLDGSSGVSDLAPLRGMNLTALGLLLCGQVRDLTPLAGMKLTYLTLPPSATDKDLLLLKGMPLTRLRIAHGGQVRDLSPIRGLPLTTLDLYRCTLVQDLSPVVGMKLTDVSLQGCTQLRDLGPLKGMPVQRLDIVATAVDDLTPLAELPLEEFRFTSRNVKRGIEAVRRLKTLKRISEVDGPSTFTPAEFWKKYDAGEFK